MSGAKDWRAFVYGGVSSILAEIGTFPIDTAKTRLQVQGQKIDERFTKLRYAGMTDALIKIFKEEGIKALYSGISPAVVRQSIYGTIKFGTYYTLKKHITESGLLPGSPTNDEQVLVNVFCAGTAGVISSTIANPTDVLKVRMQVHGKGTQNGGLVASFVDVFRHEGVRGLWRGVGPTVQRAVVIATVELPVYDFCKFQLKSTYGDYIVNHFISSFVAGVGCAAASTPIDVIRTRLMNQKFILNDGMAIASRQKIYTSGVDCAMQTIRNEGFFALYKGFVPTWLRMGPWNIIFFIIYEQLKQF